MIRLPGNALFHRRIRIPAAGNESALAIRVPDRSVQFRIRRPDRSAPYPIDVKFSTEEVRGAAAETLESAESRVPLPPGTYKAWFSASRRISVGVPEMLVVFEADEPIVVRAAQLTTCDVVWKPSAGLVFKVAFDTGGHEQEMPELKGTIVQADGTGDPTLYLQDGRGYQRPDLTAAPLYSLCLHEPGCHCLTLTAKGILPASRDVELRDGSLTHVELYMKREP